MKFTVEYVGTSEAWKSNPKNMETEVFGVDESGNKAAILVQTFTGSAPTWKPGESLDLIPYTSKDGSHAAYQGKLKYKLAGTGGSGGRGGGGGFGGGGRPAPTIVDLAAWRKAHSEAYDFYLVSLGGGAADAPLDALLRAAVAATATEMIARNWVIGVPAPAQAAAPGYKPADRPRWEKLVAAFGDKGVPRAEIEAWAECAADALTEEQMDRLGKVYPFVAKGQTWGVALENAGFGVVPF